MQLVSFVDGSADIRRDARRELEICNACRYCEGFCAVFPAMMLRREFTDGDMNYLANLCHNCKGCYHACQYAPPHPFGVNLPRTLGELRNASYEEFAWPPFLARAYRSNGVVVAAGSTLAIASALLLTGWLGEMANLTATHVGPGAFYAVIPWRVMAGLSGATFVFMLLALAVGGTRFWRSAGSARAPTPEPAGRALKDVLTLRYLGGGHEGADGCNDVGEGFSQTRRRLHHCVFYGFMLCFASTSVATVYDHFLGLVAPYPVLSLPVLLGLAGGVGLAIGTAGLIVVKVVTDPGPVSPRLLGGEYAVLGLLCAISVSGLALLALRETGAMGPLLAIHLGLVLSLFLLIPYSKMVHGLYRSLALLRNAIETRSGIEGSK